MVVVSLRNRKDLDIEQENAQTIRKEVHRNRVPLDLDEYDNLMDVMVQQAQTKKVKDNVTGQIEDKNTDPLL